MSAGTLLFLTAIAAVGFFVLAMSLTLIFKGHHIDSEIGTNKHMRQRGIRCASQQIREEEALLRGETLSDEECLHSCASCAVGECIEKPTAETPARKKSPSRNSAHKISASEAD